MPRLDIYAILEISPKASDEDVKKAYRKLALQYHPDRNQGSSQAEAKIREINAAYEILGNPESRKAYERLRFGGHGIPKEAYWPETEETIDPAVVFREMERKLQTEAKREIFIQLMKNPALVKQELALIRERVVADQGYDTFREDFIIQRAKEVMKGFITSEMETRRTRLLEVAFQMLLAQNVVRGDVEQEMEGLRIQLEKVYDEGWIQAYSQACELFYARR